jgi:hypothetical protein
LPPCAIDRQAADIRSISNPMQKVHFDAAPMFHITRQLNLQIRYQIPVKSGQLAIAPQAKAI